MDGHQTRSIAAETFAEMRRRTARPMTVEYRQETTRRIYGAASALAIDSGYRSFDQAERFVRLFARRMYRVDSA